MTTEQVTLNPFAHSFHQDPYPTYAWLRDHEPVYRNDDLDFYALTRYDDVFNGQRDHERLISGRGTVLEMMAMDLDYEVALAELPMILFMDPPRQQQLRRLVTQAFTPRRIAAMEPHIHKIAVELLDELAQQGGGDFVQDFAAQLPMNVIFTMLGVPPEDRLMVRKWIDTSLERDPEPPHIPERAVTAGGRSAEYHRALIDEQRTAGDDNMISHLIEAEVTEEDGSTRRLTDAEIRGFVGLLGGAGNETVTKLLANTAVLLQRNPDAKQAVLDDPGRIPDAIDESLRYWAPAQYNGRTAATELTLHGVTIPAGGKVLLMLGAANRDERKFPDPDVFDVDRANKDDHVSFGTGIHFCLGASLARIEARIGLQEFLARFPGYRIDEDRLEWVHSSNVHGFEHAPFTT